MKVIVTTCNEYLHVLRGFAYMFNKYWVPGTNVTVLGYSIPSFDLPDNFEFISIGEQEKYDRDWTSALIPFFKQLPDKYFVLLLDDFYVLGINESLLREAEEHMANGIERVHFTIGSRGGIYCTRKDDNFNILNQDANYRLSLQPSFFRRDYFLKYLNPGKSIWQYETQHKEPKNDGAQILVPKRDIAPFSNLVHKGKIKDSGQIKKIRKEDLNVIKQLVGEF